MALFARSDVARIEPSQLKEVMAELRIAMYFQVAIVALLIYDTLITFDKEVKHFWKIPRRPVDVIYFINRYMGIFGAIASLFLELTTGNLPLCRFSQWAMNIANWMSTILIDYVLMIRVLALSSQEKKLSIWLKTLLALHAVSRLGIIIYVDIQRRLTVGVYADISVCGAITVPAWQLGMVDWLVQLAYNILLMILALYKAAEYWGLSAGFKGFTLVKVLVEDQILYFAIVIFTSVFAILGFRLRFSNLFLGSVVSELGNPALLSVPGSRMLFNLKEAGERGQNEGTSYRTPTGTISSIDFAEPVNPQSESGTEQ